VTRDPIPDKTEDKSNLKAGGSFRAPENMPSIPFVWLLDCFSHTFSTKSDLALCQIYQFTWILSGLVPSISEASVSFLANSWIR